MSKTTVTLGDRSFSVLVTDLFSAEDRAKITAALAKFSSADALIAGANGAGLGLTPLDHVGRVYVVTFNGIEVCLLFQRQREMIDAGIATTPSVRAAEHNRNPWLRIDLLDLNEGSVHQVLDHPFAQLKRDYGNIQSLLEHTRRECDAKGYAIQGYDKRIKELESTLSKRGIAVPTAKPIQVTKATGPAHAIQLPDPPAGTPQPLSEYATLLRGLDMKKRRPKDFDALPIASQIKWLKANQKKVKRTKVVKTPVVKQPVTKTKVKPRVTKTKGKGKAPVKPVPASKKPAKPVKRTKRS